MDKLIAKHLMVSEDGAEYNVREYQEFLNATSFSSTNARLLGLSRFELAGGGYLNKRRDGSYEIVATGEVIRPAKL